MGKLRDLAKRCELITEEWIEQELLRIIRELEPIIIDMNTDQLMRGMNSDGVSLGDYNSKEYAAFKKMLNPAGVIDLKLTGDFHDSFFLEADKFPVLFNARDNKTVELVERYGENIFGLTDENRKILVKEYLKAELQKSIRKVLHL